MLIAKVILLLAISPGHAREFKGVSMPDSIKIERKEMVLNGMSMLKSYLFGLQHEVYVAGLYLENSQSISQKILESRIVKHIVMQFKMYVPKQYVNDGWERALRENCFNDCDYYHHLKTLTSWMQNFQKDEKIELTFRPEKVDVSVKGEFKGSVGDSSFSKLLLSAFIGLSADHDLRKGLLNN